MGICQSFKNKLLLNKETVKFLTILKVKKKTNYCATQRSCSKLCSKQRSIKVTSASGVTMGAILSRLITHLVKLSITQKRLTILILMRPCKKEGYKKTLIISPRTAR